MTNGAPEGGVAFPKLFQMSDKGDPALFKGFMNMDLHY